MRTLSFGIFMIINLCKIFSYFLFCFCIGRQSSCTIIFQNKEEVERNIDVLNSLKDEINNGLSGIEFIVATKGSVVLNIDILTEMFETDEKLQTTLDLFLEKIFEHITTFTTETIDIVLLPV